MPKPTPARTTERPLTPKQAMFVREYLVDLNATQAATRAGYSERTANEQGARLLANASVLRAVQEAMEARAQRVQLQSDEVLNELRILLRSDVRQFRVANDGSLTLAEGVPDEMWRAVSSVKHKIREIPTKDGDPMFLREIEFKLWDKNAAIDKAMRHLGLLKDGASLTLNQTTNTQVNVWQFGDKQVQF